MAATLFHNENCSKFYIPKFLHKKQESGRLGPNVSVEGFVIWQEFAILLKGKERGYCGAYTKLGGGEQISHELHESTRKE